MVSSNGQRTTDSSCDNFYTKQSSGLNIIACFDDETANHVGLKKLPFNYSSLQLDGVQPKFKMLSLRLSELEVYSTKLKTAVICWKALLTSTG